MSNIFVIGGAGKVARRFFDRKPEPVKGSPPWQERLARGVHIALYIVILGMVASGIGMIVLSGAGPIIFSGADTELPNFLQYPPRIRMVSARPPGRAAACPCWRGSLSPFHSPGRTAPAHVVRALIDRNRFDFGLREPNSGCFWCSSTGSGSTWRSFAPISSGLCFFWHSKILSTAQ
ncbi:hypothetical protein [Mesorhizobium sp. CAU 1732]|uniref:cytochrome b n=1 Tax=Mesorhizobium sp. CAU 1732 TaxID=3140358 RepID=UPI00326059AF